MSDSVCFAIKSQHWGAFVTQLQARFAAGVGRDAGHKVFGIPAIWRLIADPNIEYSVGSFRAEQLAKGDEIFDTALLASLEAGFNNPSGRGFMGVTNDVNEWLAGKGLETKPQD